MTRRITEEELQEQRRYAEKVRFAVNGIESELGRPLYFRVVTYGCQQNEADSEQLRGMLRDMGWGFTDREEEADFILLNTCAVRGHAELRVLGNVGALSHVKRARPGQRIALCGCMVQQPHMREKIKASYP